MHSSSNLDSAVNFIGQAASQSPTVQQICMAHGALADIGAIIRKVTDSNVVLLITDETCLDIAGRTAVSILRSNGFLVETVVLPSDPPLEPTTDQTNSLLSVMEQDGSMFPVAVGSGVINDLVKYASFKANRRYLSIATAASMDGYLSPGAPLVSNGFKITLQAMPPVAMLADLDILMTAPPAMNACGYGDLAGKIPAGGDWIIADALGIERIDEVAWQMVQDNLRNWLAQPEGVSNQDGDSVVRIFTGLTAVGLAMDVHGSSRPASGADHQIAHYWEMERLTFNGRKVKHGEAVAVSCVISLALYEWLSTRDFNQLDIAKTVKAAPSFRSRSVQLRQVISDKAIADSALKELEAKHCEANEHTHRLEHLKQVWGELRENLQNQLVSSKEMAAMLRAAGAPASPIDIGVSTEHLATTLEAAALIRRRYTIFDLLHETGLLKPAIFAVSAQFAEESRAPNDTQ